MLPVFLVELARLRVASLVLKDIIESPHLTTDGKVMTEHMKESVKVLDSIASVRMHQIEELGIARSQMFKMAITFLCESLSASVEQEPEPSPEPPAIGKWVGNGKLPHEAGLI